MTQLQLVHQHYHCFFCHLPRLAHRMALPPRPLSRLLTAFVAFAADNPLPLAYLLYFSPYIARAVGFLIPLMLTTALLLRVAPPVASADDCDGDAYSGLLGAFWSQLHACVHSATEAYPYDAEEEEDDRSLSCHEEDKQEDAAAHKEAPRLSCCNQQRQRGGGWPEEDAPLTLPMATTTTTLTARVISRQQFEAIGQLYKALTQEMYGRCLPVKALPTESNAAEAKTGLQLPAVSSDQPLQLLGRHAGILLPRCYSRASPLQGWETPGTSELDGDVGDFFSAAQGLQQQHPWRSDSMNPCNSVTPAAAAAVIRRFGGSLREGHWRRDPTTMPTPCKSMSNVHDRRCPRSDSRSVVPSIDDEGMDMLWEEEDDDDKGNTGTQPNPNRGHNNNWGTYCHDNTTTTTKKSILTMMGRSRSRAQRREDVVNDKKKKKKKKLYYDQLQEEEDADAYADDDAGGGKLCCLQALRFSTGRMRFGMGNLATSLARAFRGTTRAFRHHATSSPARRTGQGSGSRSASRDGP